MKKYLLLLLILPLLLVFGCSNTATTDDTDTESSTITEEETSDINSDILIAYFTITGNTQKVAEDISSITDGELYQIQPEENYTEADLESYNEDSRAYKEQHDELPNPKISGTVTDFEDYDYIFIGYPIWYSKAPKIINTFLESYNFSGKTIIPFCTSASSGIGSSATDLEGLAPSADWLEGMRFSTNPTMEEVEDWVNTLDINIMK